MSTQRSCKYDNSVPSSNIAFPSGEVYRQVKKVRSAKIIRDILIDYEAGKRREEIQVDYYYSAMD